jgi:YbgC/YbaW family acyl-CoA thioester hydrolase
MARIQLDLPSNFLFATNIPVRVSDVNYGGHVGNDSMLTIIQDARINYYRSLGYKNELRFEGEVGHIIADAAVVYKSEAFLGDELKVQIAITEFNKYGFDMMYLITNYVTNIEVARAKTGIVCFDYEKKKVASIPTSFLQKLKGEN